MGRYLNNLLISFKSNNPGYQLRYILITFISFFIAFFLFLIVIYPLNRQYIEIDLYTDTESYLKLLWLDNSSTYSDKNSSFIETVKGRKTYKFFIDSDSSIRDFHIQLAHKPSVLVSIYSLKVIQPGYPERILSDLALNNIEPVNDVRIHPAKQDEPLQIISTGGTPKVGLSLGTYSFSGKKKFLKHLSNASFIGGVSILLSLFLLLVFHLTDTSIKKYEKNRQVTKRYALNTQSFLLPPYLPAYSTATTLILLIASIFLYYNLYGAYLNRNLFGSHSAPLSDAFLWLKGTIHYLNHLPFKTYRPTINIFFASIYSIAERVNSIPVFSIFFFMVNFTFLNFISTVRTKVFLLFSALFFLIFFNRVIVPLNVGQLMVDFLPFSMTLFGLLYIALGIKGSLENKSSSIFITYTGLLLLGIAIALRGVQLLGGILVAVMIVAVFYRRSWRTPAFLAPIILLFPLLLDIYFQKYFGAENNGIYSLFGFYHDTHHGYTKVAKTLLKELKLASSDIILTYLRYLFSPQGIMIFYAYLYDIVQSAISLISTKSYYCLACAALIINITRNKILSGSMGFNRLSSIIIFVHFLVFPILFFTIPDALPIIVLIHTCILLWILFVTQHYTPCMFLALFTGGCILFAMMGMPGGTRVSSGFIFTLPLAWLSVLLDDRKNDAWAPTFPTNILMLLNLAIVVFLYAGNLLLPVPAVTNLKNNTTIKISEDKSINRGLYYAEDGKIFYTHLDDEKIGTITEYNEINCPHGASFKWPCTIE